MLANNFFLIVSIYCRISYKSFSKCTSLLRAQTLFIEAVNLVSIRNSLARHCVVDFREQVDHELFNRDGMVDWYETRFQDGRL